jgi:hypothetical protein
VLLDIEKPNLWVVAKRRARKIEKILPVKRVKREKSESC